MPARAARRHGGHVQDLDPPDPPPVRRRRRKGADPRRHARFAARSGGANGLRSARRAGQRARHPDGRRHNRVLDRESRGPAAKPTRRSHERGHRAVTGRANARLRAVGAGCLRPHDATPEQRSRRRAAHHPGQRPGTDQRRGCEPRRCGDRRPERLLNSKAAGVRVAAADRLQVTATGCAAGHDSGSRPVLRGRDRCRHLGPPARVRSHPGHPRAGARLAYSL